MGIVKTEPNRNSDWLLYEEDGIGRYSRDNVTVAASQTLVDGTVMGLNAAGTQVVAYDDVGPDGAVAVGILVGNVTTGVGETKPGVIVTRHARIAPDGLTWSAGLLQPAKDAALADLAAKGILTVASV